MSNHTKEELSARLKSKDRDEVIDALMYLCFNVNDPGWIQEKCMDVFTNNKDEDARSLAVVCIGHTARIHREVDRKKTVPFLKSLLNDKVFSGVAESALDDIEVFIDGET